MVTIPTYRTYLPEIFLLVKASICGQQRLLNTILVIAIYTFGVIYCSSAIFCQQNWPVGSFRETGQYNMRYNMEEVVKEISKKEVHINSKKDNKAVYAVPNYQGDIVFIMKYNKQHSISRVSVTIDGNGTTTCQGPVIR
jgi:hypothetical protein